MVGEGVSKFSGNLLKGLCLCSCAVVEKQTPQYGPFLYQWKASEHTDYKKISLRLFFGKMPWSTPRTSSLYDLTFVVLKFKVFANFCGLHQTAHEDKSVSYVYIQAAARIV